MAFQDIFSKQKRKTKTDKKPKVIVDSREKQALVISYLVKEGCEVEIKQLAVGDYIVKGTVIERKTISDFISSMINKRLIRQLNSLKTQKNKILLIEGIDEYELYHKDSEINENAIRGFLLSIILNYQVPILFTKDAEDTAKFLKVLAKKPAKESEMGINDKPRPRNVKEQLQYLLEGFPGIGPKTARKLLEEYGTLKKIINTPIEDLEKLIGKKAEIFKLSERVYHV
jgi:ERCC4-type nuclease